MFAGLYFFCRRFVFFFRSAVCIFSVGGLVVLVDLVDGSVVSVTVYVCGRAVAQR
jgi:hypothetical protein